MQVSVHPRNKLESQGQLWNLPTLTRRTLCLLGMFSFNSWLTGCRSGRDTPVTEPAKHAPQTSNTQSDVDTRFKRLMERYPKVGSHGLPMEGGVTIYAHELKSGLVDANQYQLFRFDKLLVAFVVCQRGLDGSTEVFGPIPTDDIDVKWLFEQLPVLRTVPEENGSKQK